MTVLRFKQVDVFTSVPFRGNPVAVVFDLQNVLATEQMQRIAHWTNLSETTFVVPKTEKGANADYRVRIFTPGAELPFAGHPTIGTAHALLEAGIIKVDSNGCLVQECEAGLINLKVEADESCWIEFELPRPSIIQPLKETEAKELEALLDCEFPINFGSPCLIDVGPRWVVAQLANAKNVLEKKPDMQKLRAFNERTNSTGVVIFGEYDEEASSGGQQARIEVRAFGPLHGVPEDPVCGSGNGCVGAYLRHTGQTAHFGPCFFASQGAALGRAGIVSISVSEGAIRVAGQSVTCVDGELRV